MATNSMACPVCRTGLVPTERQGIEIDACPTCRGVWLDRGELDKIVERSAQAVAPQGRAADPWPGRWHDGQPRHHHKKRRSWLEDLFD
jgi:Zn-finger nucleic acid-binding protein